MQIRDELLEFLESIARTESALYEIQDDENLVDQGVIDSLAIVQIIIYLEQKYAASLKGVDPTSLVTLSGILKVIEEAQ